MAAQCVDCGLPVSCSCQLTKGRCSACNYAYQQTIKPPVKQIKTNVVRKTY